LFSSSSTLWLNRQAKDVYTKKAVIDHFRCRSAYKLIQIDNRYRFLRPGYNVLDCGAVPGSWSQVAIERVTNSACVIGIDVKPMDPIDSVHFIQADVTQITIANAIREHLGNRALHVVLR
jgi:23S rRNA (uridine2552-2'-O)-methyltransferase